MRSVNSISGGRTSAYMALHYPTDINVFALVRTHDKAYRSSDLGLIRACENKLSGFYASHESDTTLRAVLDLEQMLGRSIDWVSAEFDLEDYCDGTTDLPQYRSTPMLFNSRRRFCTIEQKIKPIARHLHNLSDTPDEMFYMQIGFRADEGKRVENWKCTNDRIEIPNTCSLKSRRVSYTKKEWRISAFPLYTNGVSKQDVQAFWDSKALVFPPISNCQFCPFHADSELAIQYTINPERANWYIKREQATGHTFGKRPLIDRVTNPRIGSADRSCQCTG